MQRFSGFGFRSESEEGRQRGVPVIFPHEQRNQPASACPRSEDGETLEANRASAVYFQAGGNSQPRALFLPSTAKTRRVRRNKLNAEESSLGLKAQPPFSELVVITLSLRS